MRFCYADPPYPGLAHYYVENQEVNHAILIGTLQSEYPDGWALSTSAEALAQVLALCPDGVRVGAWVKGARNSKCRWPAKSWEPVVVYRGRPRRVVEYSSDMSPGRRATSAVNDSLVYGGRQHSHPGALVGMKPAKFAEWVFRMLGAEQGDRLDDLFPGSGAIGRAWTLHMRDPCDASQLEQRRFLGDAE